LSETTLHTVEKVRRLSYSKELLLIHHDASSSEGSQRKTSEAGHRLRVPLSACVMKGDRVRLNCTSAWVLCQNGEARIARPYVAREVLEIGHMSLDLLVKEVTEEEWLGCQALAHLHYRGKAPNGRTARFIVRSFHPLYPLVVGYIALATLFYMNKARAAILDAPFEATGFLAGEAVTQDAEDLSTRSGAGDANHQERAAPILEVAEARASQQATDSTDR